MPRARGLGSRGGLVIRQCPECTREFTTGRKGGLKYCSRLCSLVGRGKAGRRREQRTCRRCGQGFEIARAHATREGRGKHTGQYCSRECTYAYWREHPEQHPFVRGKTFTERIDEQGYVWVTVPGRGRVRQHVLVVERELGRPLDPWETVHHKNAIRSDNRPENLELWQGKQPAGARSADLVLERLDQLERRLAALEARIGS